MSADLTAAPLACPRCAAPLAPAPEALVCSGCRRTWPVRNGIPRFVEPEGYWGEIARAEAAALVRAAAEKGWRQAVTERFAGDRDMLLSLLDWQRAAWLPLLALPEGAVALDIGSGYGAITQSLSHAAASVYSLEAITERIEFTAVRLAQESVRNVRLVQASAVELPFTAETFDLVVVNGVLEWVGAWRTEGSPRAAQLDFLRAVHRMLKPDGVLVIGIENRFSLEALRGGVDHSGLAYTSLMPRPLASLYVRRQRGPHYRTASEATPEYRTYTYTERGYRKLLAEVGFAPDIYWPYPGYNEPLSVIPLDNGLVHDQLLVNLTEPLRARHGGWRTPLKRMAAASGLLRRLVPDFLILATKTGRPGPVARFRARLDRVVGADRTAGTSRVSLAGGHFATKTVIRLYGDGAETPRLVLKASTPARGSAAATVDEYQKLAMVFRRAQLRRPRFSVPRPLGSYEAAGYQYTVESTAAGEPLSRLLFLLPARRRLQLLRRELPRCADVLIDMARMLHGVTQVDEVPASAYPLTVQHGDLTIENVLLDRRTGRVAVIDWQHLVRGVPPLYDCFALLASALPAIAVEPGAPDPDRARFLTAFFADGPWARLFREVIRTVADGLDVTPADVWTMFREFLTLRARYHDSRDREAPLPSGGGLAHVYEGYRAAAEQYRERFIVAAAPPASGARIPAGGGR